MAVGLTAGLEKQIVLKKVLGVLKVFLYEDRTRKYDPEAHEKHPIHGISYYTPV